MIRGMRVRAGEFRHQGSAHRTQRDPHLPVARLETALTGLTRTRALLLCGVVGPPLFIATFLVEEATRPGYSWWRNFVSSLATGEGGWVQTASFLIWGTLATLFAIGVVRVGLITPGILLFLYGAGLLVAGIFVTDPSLGYPPGAPPEHTTHGMIHGLAGLAVFTLNAVAAFVVARHFAREPRWRGWAIYSAITGLLIVVLFIASTAASVQDELGLWPNAPVGLLQRISIVVGWTWIAAFALRLWRDATPFAPSPPSASDRARRAARRPGS